MSRLSFIAGVFLGICIFACIPKCSGEDGDLDPSKLQQLAKLFSKLQPSEAPSTTTTAPPTTDDSVTPSSSDDTNGNADSVGSTTRTEPAKCKCVPFYLCDLQTGSVKAHGENLIQFRTIQEHKSKNGCHYMEICCEVSSSSSLNAKIMALP